MVAYKRIGEGRLYINNFKVADKQPDYRGHITINNREYSIAGWDNGSFISLNISNGLGKLFKNANSSGNYPDFSGKINKGPSSYLIAGWNNGNSIGLKLSSK
tara:strand:- start:3329 stop:3634 length:306 start_codon:yes stop_codon:yes gene_type:complete